MLWFILKCHGCRDLLIARQVPLESHLLLLLLNVVRLGAPVIRGLSLLVARILSHPLWVSSL